jgi:predicted anti-sigma-YlaC factor YlaD
MNADLHERARTMIALSGPEQLPGAEQSWLAAHLASCPACRDFAESSRETILSLRGTPVAASRSLVSATQLRVRQRAADLQRRQERLWMVCACCAAVTLSATVTTTLLWRAFSWIGQRAQLSAPVWEGLFVVFCLMPAVVAGMVLLARGTFLADHDASYEG